MEEPGDDRIETHAEAAFSEADGKNGDRETRADGGEGQERIRQQQDQAETGEPPEIDETPEFQLRQFLQKLKEIGLAERSAQ